MPHGKPSQRPTEALRKIGAHSLRRSPAPSGTIPTGALRPPAITPALCLIQAGGGSKIPKDIPRPDACKPSTAASTIKGARAGVEAQERSDEASTHPLRAREAVLLPNLGRMTDAAMPRAKPKAKHRRESAAEKRQRERDEAALAEKVVSEIKAELPWWPGKPPRRKDRRSPF